VKLTAFDPAASVYRQAPREVVVLKRDDGSELLMQSASPNELPPMDLPLPTEPGRDDSAWHKPAPPSMWQEEIESPWLVRLYGWAFVAAIVCSALLVRCAP
jgi:hypothetical protein